MRYPTLTAMPTSAPINSTWEPPCAAEPGSLYLAVARAITLSATTGDALDALFEVLRHGCGALALALETTADLVNRLQPYGDIAALMETSAGDARAALVLSAALGPPDGSPGARAGVENPRTGAGAVAAGAHAGQPDE